MPLDVTGFIAKIENLQGYLTGVKSMEVANARLAQAQLRSQNASDAAANGQENFARRIAKAEAAVVEANRKAIRDLKAAREDQVARENLAADRRTKAEEAVSKASRRATEAKKKDINEQVRANDALKKSEAELAIVIRKNQELLARGARTISATSRRGTAGVARATGVVEDLKIAEQQQAAIAARNLAIAQQGITAAGGKVSKQLTLAQAALLPFTAGLRGAQAASTLFGKTLLAVSGFSNRFAVSLRFGAAAVTAFLAAFTVGAASNFEDQLTKIDNLTNLTTQDTKRLGDQILRLSETIPKSPTEIGATAYQVLSSGISDLDTAMEILENSTKAATVSQTNSADVARTTTAVIKAYGESNISAAQTTDILLAATREGRVEFSDFAGEIGRLLGIAPSLGIEFDELAAALASLTNFLPASQAGTALLGVMNQLISPSAQSEELFKQLGTSVEEFRAAIDEKGLLTALQELAVKGENNIRVFETLFPEVRGLNGVLLLMRDSGGEAAGILEKIRASAGITETAFAKANKTFSAQAQLLKNQLSIIFIQLGTQILPFLNQKIQELIGWLQKNRQAIQETVKAFVEFGALVAEIAIKGIGAVIRAFDVFLSKKAAIIAGIAAIGLAIVIALGPGSAALLAVLAIIGLLGSIEKFGTGVADSINRKLGIATSTSGSGRTGKILEDAKNKGAVNASQFERALRDAGGVPEFAIKEISEKYTAQVREELKAKSEAGEATKAQNEAISQSQIELEKVIRQYNDEASAAGDASAVTSALSDGIIDFAEASELGISAMAAGALEAGALQDEAAEKAFNFTKAMSLVANAFSRGADVAQRVVLKLARTGFEATQSAASALFSRPTREISRLELALARLRLANSGLIRSLDADIKRLQGRLTEFDEQQSRADQARAARDLSDELRKLQQDLAKAPRDEREGIQEQISGIREQQNDLAREAGVARQRKAIEDEIASREEQIAKLEEQENSIQLQIDTYNLQNEVLQKQIQASDATLLSQGELTKAAQEVARVTGEQSTIIRALSKQLGIDLIPEMDTMREQAALVRGAFQVLNDETLRANFIPTVETASTAVSNATIKVDEFATTLGSAIDLFNEKKKELGESTVFPNGSPLPPPLSNPFQESFAFGGFVNKTTPAILHGPEVVLPLKDKARSRELVRALPASLVSQIGLAGQSGSGSAFGDINVQGYIPMELENVVIGRIRRESARSRRMNKLVGL